MLQGWAKLQLRTTVLLRIVSGDRRIVNRSLKLTAFIGKLQLVRIIFCLYAVLYKYTPEKRGAGAVRMHSVSR